MIEAKSNPPYPLTVYFDGDCPICAREIALLKRLNRHNLVEFVDFADPGYDPRQSGLDRAELGRVIHARWADGSMLVGVDVFREVWSAVGFGFVARLSRLPIIDRVLVWGYDWFARNRLWLTGRAGPDVRSRGQGEDHNKSCPRCTGQRRAG